MARWTIERRPEVRGLRQIEVKEGDAHRGLKETTDLALAFVLELDLNADVTFVNCVDPRTFTTRWPSEG